MTGVVMDNKGEPLIGATVQQKGSSLGTITDTEGKFSFNVEKDKGVLVVSYIGFKVQEIPFDSSTNHLKVIMQENDAVLDEVVVVGAGTQKKVSVTGAIVSVKGSSLKIPSTSLSHAFAGRIAGVVAKQTSGQPGSGSEFYIRGIGTFGGRATPLILLDEVEISAGDLNYVPAENIESFSILKDASATAIYGSRGANGVMIVTTKTGEYNSKARINITVENSFNTLDKFPEFVDGARYMEIYNQASVSRGGKPRYSAEDIERTASGFNPLLYPDIDWREVIFKDMAMRQRANINVSGGGSKAKYYMSLEATHEDGLLNTKKVYSWNNNINVMNYTFQNNITYKLTPSTTIKLNMNAQIRQTRGPNVNTVNLFNNILTTAPILFPVTYPQQQGVEHIMFGNAYISGTNLYTNPYAQMLTSFQENNSNTLNTVLKIDQDLDFIAKGLKFNGWINFKNWSQSVFARSINPHFYGMKAESFDPDDPSTDYELELLNTNGTDYISQGDVVKSTDQTFELQGALNYSTQLGEHALTAMLLYRQREYRGNGAALPNRNQGVSGRITWDYGHKYLAEFNFGYNGTECLSRKDRFGFFPAISLGWVVSGEKFFEPLTDYIDHFKLRGSYGLVGSDELASPSGSHYLYIDKIQDNNINYLQYKFGEAGTSTLGGPMLTYYAMPGLGWEKVKKLDIGFDLTLFKDWKLTFDYFKDRRYDIFMNRDAWPQSLGYHIAKPWANIGKMNNESVEFSLNYSKAISKELNISLIANFTYNVNKIVYQDEPNYPSVWQMAIGKPYQYTKGYIAEGLFQSQEEIDNSPQQNLGSTPRVGDIKYRDINGDGIISDTDMCMISKFNTTPRIQYGFGATINYKKFDFGIFFNGSGMRTIMTNGMDPFLQSAGSGNRNVVKYIADNYFTEEKQNFDATYPRLGLLTTDIANNRVPSTYWMRNGSFMRLKNLEVGYRIPYGRIYISGANLLTFSPFDLWDPELAGWNSYPLQRTVNIGVQLNF
ncbi:TonB-dependent receptor [Bacteroides sp.]|uniref:SusC/RagA family TonB-linked outer membrane protein n=1 Tax=Bacteroides sp. TaxID=29523 RepID=UPI00258032EC|nr:TonB-dependent receptor [Bacteroides sp.]